MRQKKVPKKILKISIRLKINFGFLKVEKTQAHTVFEKKKGDFIMTEKALGLLSDKCKEHLETLSILIKRYKEGNEEANRLS